MLRPFSIVRLFAAFAFVLLPGLVAAQDDTPVSTPDPNVFDIGLEAVAEGLDQPISVIDADDDADRLFVLEQSGRIRVIDNGSLVDAPFLDLTDRVGSDGSEQGLLGLAFPADYADSGLFYVDYTDLNGNTVVSRFSVTDDPLVADPGSEAIVLQQEQPFPNHNGGQLAFGPDGYLYVSFGDGGSQGDPNGNGQNLGVWLGKILRIDVDPAHLGQGDAYVVPDDNPFVDQEGAKPEIWAYGLRNPWRFSFDMETGDLWIADVGQNEIEEVNHVAGTDAGLDFGWNIMEGTNCYASDPCDQTGLTLPVMEYTHEVGGCSVTGGFVYRGEDMPALAGTYLFGDYCSGLIWQGVENPDGTWTMSDPVETGLSISSFGEDEAGNLYLTDLSGGGVYLLAPPL